MCAHVLQRGRRLIAIAHQQSLRRCSCSYLWNSEIASFCLLITGDEYFRVREPRHRSWRTFVLFANSSCTSLPHTASTWVWLSYPCWKYLKRCVCLCMFSCGDCLSLVVHWLFILTATRKRMQSRFVRAHFAAYFPVSRTRRARRKNRIVLVF